MGDTGETRSFNNRVMNEPIPIIRPDIAIGDLEDDIKDILETGILTSGKYVAEFEESVASWVGVEHGIATSSATTALHLSLSALGVGPGDEVMLSDFTYPATANVVVQTGATPVFVDSGTDDLSMDPEHARALVGEKTRVIMPVDPLGQPADHASLEQLGSEADIAVVVDAACALGASRDGRRSGSHGDMGCFSFHPRKVVTCGEGGMVTTGDPDLADRLRLLRNHGARKASTRAFEFVEPGFNYRLSEIPAALGISQMRRIEEILSDRRATATRYDTEVSALSGVQVLSPPPDVHWTYQSYVILIDESIERDQVISRMSQEGIETTIGTYACHQHPAFSKWGYRPGDLPNSGRFADTTLTLPLVPRMTNSQIERVVETLSSILSSF